MSYPAPYARGLYWRRSPVNGRKCVPVILALVDGFLTMTARHGQVFSVHASALTVSRSRWGTLILTFNGEKYAFVGRGSAISPKFTARQKAELGKLDAPSPPEPMAPSRMGANSAMLGNTVDWPDKLRASGAATG